MDNLDFFFFSEKNYRYFRATDHENWFDKNMFIKGQVEISRPVDFWHYMGGSIPQDLVATGWSSLYLLSDKAIMLLHENNITGWKSYPVLLHDKKGNIIDGYALFAITGRCGVIDWTKSERFQKQFAPNAPFTDMLRGIHIDWNTWDRNDFFLPENTTFILVTHRVKDLFVRHNITNTKFTALEKFEMIKP